MWNRLSGAVLTCYRRVRSGTCPRWTVHCFGTSQYCVHCSVSDLRKLKTFHISTVANTSPAPCHRPDSSSANTSMAHMAERYNQRHALTSALSIMTPCAITCYIGDSGGCPRSSSPRPCFTATWRTFRRCATIGYSLRCDEDQFPSHLSFLWLESRCFSLDTKHSTLLHATLIGMD